MEKASSKEIFEKEETCDDSQSIVNVGDVTLTEGKEEDKSTTSDEKFDRKNEDKSASIEEKKPQRLGEFSLDPRFESIRTVGYGDYGFLAISRVKATGEVVAVRKSYDVFHSLDGARELAKELKIIRCLGHPNVENLLDVFASPSEEHFMDLFVVTRLMDTSIANLLFRGESFSDDHVKNIIYQLLCALKHIHSANIVHRDLKQVSILIKKEERLIQVGNFQAAHNIGEVDVETDRFVGHTYESASSVRSPEMILKHRFVTPAADIWGVACTFWELLGGRRFFTSYNEMEEVMNIIFRMTGLSPSDIGYQNPAALVSYLQEIEQWPMLPESRPFNFEQALPGANSEAIDLLRRMIKLNPADRITVDEALSHPYLLDVPRTYDAEMNRHSNQQVDLQPFKGVVPSADGVKALLLDEIRAFQDQSKAEKNETGSLRENLNKAESKI